MTEPISLTVASLLAGGFLAEAGSGAWRTATRIAAFLRDKFASDQSAIDALEECERDPSSATTRNDLRSVLDLYVTRDQEFHDQLLSTLKSEGSDANDVLNTQVAVTDQAQVGKIVQIKSVQGDVSF